MPKYVAQQFLASSPGQEVIGQIAIANTQSIRREEIEPLLKKYGLENIDPTKWYPHQKVLDMYREIGSGDTNVTETLVAIGMAGVKNTPLPPEENALSAVIENQESFYHWILRPVVEGEGTFVKRIADRHYHIRLNTPYPTDLLYGYLWGLVNRAKLASDVFTVQIIANPNPETEPGAFIEIKWGPTTDALK